MQQKIKRHLTSVHRNDPRVISILKSADPEREFYKVMCQGNHEHNKKIISGERQGELIVLKRPRTDTQIESFGPCHACTGYVLKAELWRHAKRCPLMPTGPPQRNSQLRQLSTSVEGGPEEAATSARFMEDIFSTIRDDELKQVIANDDLLKALGSYMLTSKGKTGSLTAAIKQRLRSLAKLILCLREKTGNESLTLDDILQPRHFDNIISSVQQVCSWELGDSNQPPSFKTPSSALKLGHALKKAAEVAVGLAARAEDAERGNRLEDYIRLHQREWGDRISHAALSTLDLRKMNVQDTLPLTEDLVTLSNSLRERIAEVTTSLVGAHSSHEETKLYNELVTLTSASVTVFNKRRGGESARLLLETYVNRRRGATNKDIAATLSPLERKLAEKMDLVEVLGKRKRRVPIILAPFMRTAMDLIVRLRPRMSLRGNPYIFAKAKAKSYVPGWSAIKSACGICELKKPELITSTKIRKYLATVTQVLQLDEQQLEWVANHLGHSLDVHRHFYRLPSDVLQLTKVSQLLLAAEQGCINSYKDKSLNDLDVKG